MSNKDDMPPRPSRHANLRVVVTGPVGVDKKPFLEDLARLARSRGNQIRLFHVGDLMYADAPDVAPGRILDLPLGRLNSIRRSVFKEIISHVECPETVIVNTHASFRWRHGLFPAFDHDLMQRLDADLYVTFIDNVDAVHERLDREHRIDHNLNDVLIWREEEILATEVLASAIRGPGSFYIVSHGDGKGPLEALYRLIFEPKTKKVYLSYPMTHVADLPDTLESICAFRAKMAEHFTAFDPSDLDDKHLLNKAVEASAQGNASLLATVNGRDVRYDVEEVFRIAKYVDAQIYARDFKLIDQSDMIISYIPELPDGKPGLSSGVERELQHAHEVTRDVYIIWESESEPSPFVTTTATRIFRTVDAALEYFQKAGFCSAAAPEVCTADKA
ncbi:MAG: AAA family ATPase [Phycisphaerae bacterium]|jgi:adenylate kinase